VGQRLERCERHHLTCAENASRRFLFQFRIICRVRVFLVGKPLAADNIVERFESFVGAMAGTIPLGEDFGDLAV